MLYHSVYGLNCLIFALIAIVILWANPRRPANVAICVNATIVAAWALLTHFAINRTDGTNGAWLRAQGAFAGLIPLSLIQVRDAILGQQFTNVGEWINRRWLATAATMLLVIIPVTNSYIPYSSTPTHHARGWGYSTVLLIDISIIMILVVDSIRRDRQLRGRQKIEMRSWVITSCVFYLSYFYLLWCWHYLGWGNRDVFKISVGLTVVTLAVVAISLVVRNKLFDAQSLLLSVSTHIMYLTTLAAAMFGLWHLSEFYELQPWALSALAACIAWSGIPLKRLLDRLFEAKRAKLVHREFVELSRTAVRLESYRDRVVHIWQRWADSEHAFLWIISDETNTLAAGEQPPHEAMRALQDLQWATPKRLQRLRQENRLRVLERFLAEKDLGAVVLAEGPYLRLVAGLGSRPTRKPYTYKQVLQLQEMLPVVTAALERIVAVEKAATAERLATVGLMGASVAHEIRNPVFAIKTFAQLLPDHYEENEFRQDFSRVIKEEAARIDELTGQLLDLAAPSRPTERVDVHATITSAVDAVRPRARQLRTEWILNLRAMPSEVWTARSVLKQVILNLLINALHSLEKISADRWIKISTSNGADSVELIVEDNGPGISPEIWPKLFAPFQTTKSQGFGLGLAVSRDLLSRAGATIHADPPAAGTGAVFRIELPQTRPLPTPERAPGAS